MNANDILLEGCKKQPSVFLKKSIPLIILIIAGIIYYLIYRFLEIGIPCIFRLYTGLLFGKELYCPGCGVTRMIDAEIKLNFKQAFLQNQMVFILQPFIIFEIMKLVVNHYRESKIKYYKIENVMLVISAISLIVFGIWRNIIYMI